MAQTTGYKCDVCGKFEMSSGEAASKPDGWLYLSLANPSYSGDKWDICSALCLAKLGVLRHEIECGQVYKLVAPRKTREISEKGREKMRESGRRLQSSRRLDGAMDDQPVS